MNAASVAVPMLMMAAVLIPASTTGNASGSSTKRSRCHDVSPIASAIVRYCGSTPASPACVLRTIGSNP